jgi:hypothetical protein
MTLPGTPEHMVIIVTRGGLFCHRLKFPPRIAQAEPAVICGHLGVGENMKVVSGKPVLYPFEQRQIRQHRTDRFETRRHRKIVITPTFSPLPGPIL